MIRERQDCLEVGKTGLILRSPLLEGTPALLSPACVNMGKCMDLSNAQLPYLQIGQNNSAHFTQLKRLGK